jgi:hypothetical protein
MDGVPAWLGGRETVMRDHSETKETLLYWGGPDLDWATRLSGRTQ